MMKAKALVLTEPNKPLELMEFELPEPAPRQVLVKITAAGICGSDIHMWEGKDPRTPYPIILGHEGVGEVFSTGDVAATVDGSPLKEGDPIVWERSLVCGVCPHCARGEEFLCDERKIYGINMGCAKPPHLSGNYAEYILLRAETRIYRIPDELDPAALVAATCSGTTAAHAHEAAGLLPGDKVLIFGAGPIAAFQAAFARRDGAGKVIVITNRDGLRAEMVKEFGVDEVITRSSSTADDIETKVGELTQGRGADMVIDTTPSPDVLTESMSLLRRGGTYVNSGAAVPGKSIPLDVYSDVTRKNVTIKGVWASDSTHLEQAIELVQSGGFDFSSLVSHRFKLSEHEEAGKVVKRKDRMKVIFRPND